MSQAQTTRYTIDGYRLRIVDSAYLVQVETESGAANSEESCAILPDWAFHSRHAIWFVQDGASMMERAMRGEQIKSRIMQKGDNVL